MSYDDSYREIPALFGTQPEPVLVRYTEHLDPVLPVLDVGAGQGRNTLWLARRGQRVVALDPSAEAISQVRRIAEAESLPMTCVQEDLFEFDPGDQVFGAVLVFGLIQILTREAIAELKERTAAWTAPGGLIFVTAWTARDDRCSLYAKKAELLGPHSYRLANGEVRTYLDDNEILDIYAGFESVYHREGWGPMHRHGDGPTERHFMVEAVLRKPRSP